VKQLDFAIQALGQFLNWFVPGVIIITLVWVFWSMVKWLYEKQGSDKDAVIKLSWVIAGFFLMPVGILILQGYLGFGYAALISVPIGLVWVISAWVVISWLNIVKADEVALLYFFGNIRRRRLTSGNGIRFLGKSGLHFVPWFPGISLLRFPKDLILDVFAKDPDPKVPGWEMSGEMLLVRSEDNQKMNIEMTFAYQFATEDVDALITLIEAGVPVNDPKARKQWIRDTVATDVLYVFGQKKYKQVAGGKANDDLNTVINTRLTNPDSMLRRAGFFGKDVNDSKPGTGQAYLKITFVHLSGELGKQLEHVETAKLEAEAAHSEAERDAKFLYEPINMAMEQWVDQQVQNAGPGADRRAIVLALHKSGAYAAKEKEVHEIRKIHLPDNDYQVIERRIKLDVPGGSGTGSGEGGSSILKQLTALIGSTAAAFSAGKEGGGAAGSGKKRKTKRKGKKYATTDDEDDE